MSVQPCSRFGFMTESQERQKAKRCPLTEEMESRGPTGPTCFQNETQRKESKAIRWSATLLPRPGLGHNNSSTAFLLHLTMSATSPTGADFSSAPPKRTKIVLLGDQSVGKTSLITRSVPSHAVYTRAV
jgi:hypothetical protein